jgi:hypothetical protein
VESFTISQDGTTYQVTTRPSTSFWTIVEEVGIIVGAAAASIFTAGALAPEGIAALSAGEAIGVGAASGLAGALSGQALSAAFFHTPFCLSGLAEGTLLGAVGGLANWYLQGVNVGASGAAAANSPYTLMTPEEIAQRLEPSSGWLQTLQDLSLSPSGETGVLFAGPGAGQLSWNVVTTATDYAVIVVQGDPLSAAIAAVNKLGMVMGWTDSLGWKCAGSVIGIGSDLVGQVEGGLMAMGTGPAAPLGVLVLSVSSADMVYNANSFSQSCLLLGNSTK